MIRKVRVATGDKVAVAVRDGTADRGDMARVDVFAKASKRGKREFYVVPIYPHQVADRNEYAVPPNRAINAFKPEDEWYLIDGNFEFLFSLTQNSLAEIIKPDGEVIRGYFRGVHRGTGNITLALPENPRDLRAGLGPRRLVQFRKLAVDRLGMVSAVEREVRTWHGEACT